MTVINSFREDYSFLSNFHPSPFKYAGLVYPTNEHFFQAMKTEDMDSRRSIASAPSPGAAKRMGRHIPIRDNWEEIKLEVMLFGLRRKFSDPALRDKLLATGDEKLIEGNYWHDTFWGVCQGNCRQGPHLPEGENHLGILLMQVREEIKSGLKEEPKPMKTPLEEFIIQGERFVVAATGTRDLDLEVNNDLANQLFERLCVDLLKIKAVYPNLLVLSGGAEGWDRIVAKACMDVDVDFALVLPTQGYGEYYYRDHSVTGTDQYHLFCEMRDRALYIEYYPNRMMQFPNSDRWGYQNMVRNQRMVGLAVYFLVYAKKDGGTGDCIRRIIKAGLHYFDYFTNTAH